MSPSRRPALRLLLVEDDEVDREAVERAVEEAAQLGLEEGFACQVHHARDGDEALALLRGGSQAPLPHPCLILLDIKLPRMGGLEFLACLRADPDLTDCVVFVLTTSEKPEDRAGAYRSHVAGYVSKRRVSEAPGALAGLLLAYWRLVDLP
ncbi:response regulator [Uliginosibacterium sp. H1]|uniref:response regulator n=1 Tax=Uliginosibacterium sp. H1 TaxID=3114757 RepID=UPI002E16ECB7|nr:response regulator [Uliginosibacterium sp. H1]